MTAGLLLLSGCDQPKRTDPPLNRYQAVAMPDSTGVYVLDTRDGMISQCSTDAKSETWCTRATSATNGTGPPAWINAAQ